MVRICICYNDQFKELAETFQVYLEGLDGITLECYNEDNARERKKAFAIKSHFAAHATPFCGIYQDGKAIKGFYSEVEECTQDNIGKFLTTFSSDK